MKKSKKLICPECGHDQFICKALISATLKTVYDDDDDDDGELDYELKEWDDVESIEYFDCGKCGFAFQGNEDRFREFLKSKSVKN